jgi:hypothetical protein
LVHDLIKPFYDKQKTVINEIKWARWATFLIGIIAVLVGFKGRELPLRFLGFYDAVFMSGLILIPLIAGIIGLKTDPISLVIFCVVFCGSVIISFPFIRPDVYKIFFVSTTLATLLFFISHCIINKGFVLVKHTKDTSSIRL